MYDPRCKHCKHFRQHYVQNPFYEFVPCSSGHCERVRFVQRKPESRACEHFLPSGRDPVW